MTDEQHHRHIRSFVRREGKLTTGQSNAIEQLWPTHGVDLSNSLLAFDTLFARSAPTVLEIGFGNGLSLADMAEQHPELNFFGVEVHRPGVGSLLVQVKQRGLENVRVSQDDAVQVLEQQVPEGSLHRVQIFFPDPWHKKRHHKRRLLQAEFVAALVQRLAPGGTIHVATDWEHYAEHILEVLAANTDLENTSTHEHGYVDKPAYRPDTKYEARGIRLGHGVWDLVFKKN
ncbi:tRNA (guanosine(46)-N7)-methyltransferase TrmB [Arenicella xantha]|uniref:tRNA (guanine-N(7)-)-methyltransferase n=1 Tax=Arenicella xantha TaxID=644221 RepID=A0A395JSQ2_9GAMM|nr:tRNA (guanosine(46)-N7)-methyltransferase TrmB [Arenicella xantha]RBP53496.1 tRNA (guanine-N(7)-)-methyltransferase [Arenicella xantha]